MKALITADLHLKNWSDRVYNQDGVPKRLEEILNTFTFICEYAVKNDIKIVIVAGDTNDLKGTVHTSAFVLLRNILKKYDIQFIFIHGNHDGAQRGSNIRSAIQLLEYQNVKIIVEPEVIDDIAFVPWSRNIPEDIRRIDGRVLISHFGLSDAVLSTGVSIQTRLSSNDLLKFEKVILGHYHKPQEVGHVLYVGSPVQLSLSEREEEKRFLLMDTDKENIEILSIPTRGYRRYIQLIIDNPDEVENIFNQAKQLMDEGNFVSIKSLIKEIPLDVPENISFFNEYREDFQIRGIRIGMSIKEQMKKYLEIKNIPEQEHERFIDVCLAGFDKSGEKQ